MTALLAAADLLLLLGATLRAVRLIVADDIPGNWWIKPAAWKLMGKLPMRETTRANYWGGLSCPFCIGLWIAAAMVLILAAVGGPGHAPDWWRIIAGILTLNWVAAHLGVRAGDTND